MMTIEEIETRIIASEKSIDALVESLADMSKVLFDLSVFLKGFSEDLNKKGVL